ncbi:hypothetical protein [Actinomadura sp. HBU206391]|uniref:hypothetical protein n=1 Tax=Actinomadura sp. HBU206391 TaxID=2731692 RepID=UPI0016503C79|nr:hypothetical protein [Actinomadura sp. HBU206391]MBC6457122.1 hypothetical protein [Actinomadura sp. HBU206391]
MTDEERLTRLRAEHPGWNIWRARTATGGPGMWMATRDRVLTTEEMYDGLAHTLAEDRSDLLGDALAAQRRIEIARAQELI